MNYMMKSIQLFFLFFLFFSTSLIAQDRIAEGTHSNRGTGSYFPMVTGWVTDVYEDYHLETSSGDFRMNFRMLKPNGYNPEDIDKEYPLIVMTHGAGEAGVK